MSLFLAFFHSFYLTFCLSIALWDDAFTPVGESQERCSRVLSAPERSKKPHIQNKDPEPRRLDDCTTRGFQSLGSDLRHFSTALSWVTVRGRECSCETCFETLSQRQQFKREGCTPCHLSLTFCAVTLLYAPTGQISQCQHLQKHRALGHAHVVTRNTVFCRTTHLHAGQKGKVQQERVPHGACAANAHRLSLSVFTDRTDTRSQFGELGGWECPVSSLPKQSVHH